MTFTEPSFQLPDLPLVSDPINTLLGATDTNQFPPIIQTLPRAQLALQRSAAQLAPIYSQFSQPVQNAVFQLSQQRVAKGQSPLSANQTLSALKAASTGQVQTPAPSDSPYSLGSLWHNAVSDLFDIGRSLPKLPLAALHEAEQLPQLPGALSKAASSGNPFEFLAGAARAPGLRFIPGSFTLGNLASGEVDTAAQHPLMTLLDVLPAAGKLAGGTAVGKAAEAAGMNPLRATLTRTLGEGGELVPGRAGAVTDALGQTKPGQLLRETFGAQSRQTASMAELANIELRRKLNPASTYANDDPLAVIGRATTQLAHDAITEFKITPDRHPAVLEAFQTGDISGLADNELAFYHQAADVGSRITRYKVNNDLLVERDGRYYLPEQASKLQSADVRLASRRNNIIHDILPRVERAIPNDPRIQTFYDTLKAATDPSSGVSYGDALRLFNNLTKARTRLGAPGQVGKTIAPSGETTLGAVANLRQGLRDVLAAERRVARLDQEVYPANVVPLIQRQVDQALIDRYATPETVAQVSAAVMERNFDAIPGFNTAYLRDLQDSIGAGWRTLEANAPVPPIFIHQVSPARAAILDFPRISDRETTVTSLRQRTLDYTPYVRDVTVGLRHEALEMLRLQGEQAAAKEILGMYGRKLYSEGIEGEPGYMAGALQDYIPQARSLAASNPRLDVQSVAAQLLYREYTPYDPSSFAPYATPKALGIPSIDANPILIPKVVANTMERMFGGERIGPIAQLFSPIMKVFRTSVLPLSPRWHCVPAESEILTQNGWMTYDKLLDDDEVLVFDTNTQQFHWEIPQSISTFDFEGDLLTLDGFAATPDHKWPYISQWNRSHSQEFQLGLGKDINRTDHLLRAALTPVPSDDVLSPRDAAILGWILTDGSMYWAEDKWPQGCIYQSRAKYLDEIVELLGNEAGKVSEVTGWGQCCRVVVRASYFHRLHNAGYHDKDNLQTLILGLSRPALEAMYDAMIKGDGHHNGNTQAFCQNEGLVRTGFQLLCFLLGRKFDDTKTFTTVGGSGNGTKLGYLTRIKKKSTVHYTGIIWCPTTSTGTWVMRQNGRVVVTGNTNNILGGAIMLMAQTDPVTVWRHLGEARTIARDIHALEGTDTIPRELALRIGQRDINREISLRDELSIRSGVTQGRIFRQIQEAKSLGKVKDAFGRVVDKSYDFNGHIDDMYRTMAYLYGTDKALTRGLSREAAQQAGVELLKKTMITWDNATPIERSIIRNIMPFYGFTSHMMRYVMRYPGDHPVRASVLAQVARTEIEDQGSGLPAAFLNAFFFGSQDAGGNQSAFNLSAVNPFATIANNFQLAGFVSGLNPGLSTLLQSLGVDTSRGAPELYPQLAYDPDTGRLTAQTSNPILGLIQNTLPQSRLLGELMGTSSEFKALLRSNPEGAKRLIQSQLGLPVIYRSYNVPQEVAKAEVTRMTDQQTALSTALRTGDYSDASKYPGLVPLINQIHALQAQGLFQQFTPTTAYPSNPELLFSSGLNTVGQ